MSRPSKVEVIEALKRDYGYYGAKAIHIIQAQDIEIGELRKKIEEMRAWNASFPDRVAVKLEEIKE